MNTPNEDEAESIARDFGQGLYAKDILEAFDPGLVPTDYDDFKKNFAQFEQCKRGGENESLALHYLLPHIPDAKACFEVSEIVGPIKLDVFHAKWDALSQKEIDEMNLSRLTRENIPPLLQFVRVHSAPWINIIASGNGTGNLIHMQDLWRFAEARLRKCKPTARKDLLPLHQVIVAATTTEIQTACSCGDAARAINAYRRLPNEGTYGHMKATQQILRMNINRTYALRMYEVARTIPPRELIIKRFAELHLLKTATVA